MPEAKKILIIRFSSIGDIVLTSPVIRCLKKQLKAEVHYLTKQSYYDVLKANPYLDKIYVIKKEITELIPALQKEQYDYLIDLHKNLRSLHLRLRLNVKTFAFDKINFQKWLMVGFKINRLPKIHIVDRYIETVYALGVQNDKQGLDYFIPPEDEIVLDDFFQKHLSHHPISNDEQQITNQQLTINHPYTAFVIGAAHKTKRLPIDKIISLCQKMKGIVVLLGGPDEAKEGAEIVRAAGNHIINTCGILTLNQSASLVQQATKVITHDTGLMHIAAAFQKEIISIWGNTIPEFGMYPYYPPGIELDTTIQVHGLSCRPCSKIGFQKCPKGHFQCMGNIDEQKILAHLD